MEGKEGVSPSYAELYIDLSLYSPLTEVIREPLEEFLIPNLCRIRGAQEVLQAAMQAQVKNHPWKMYISFSHTLKIEKQIIQFSPNLFY